MDTNDTARLYEARIKEYAGRLSPVVLESTDSTNAYAMRLAASGAPEGTAVVACRQTAGRGRLGRSFFSPEGGVYLSLILRPSASPQAALMLTVAAAAATAGSIELLCGRQCGIKWVNDIFIDGRKVCGILTEGAVNAGSGRLDYAVLGVGVNLSPPPGGFPAEVSGIAGALFDKPVSYETRARLIGLFAERFFEYYDAFEERGYMAEYKKRSILYGKSVTYMKNNVLHTARVVGINDDAGLVLDENGTEVVLAAGEVSVRI